MKEMRQIPDFLTTDENVKSFTSDHLERIKRLSNMVLLKAENEMDCLSGGMGKDKHQPKKGKLRKRK